MTMSLDEAISTVARFSKMFEAMQTLADQVDSVKKINQLADEAQARVAGYADKEKAMKADLDKLQKKLDDAMARDAATASRLVNDAEAQASLTIEKARAEAQAILAQAENMANTTRAKADAETAPLIAKAANAASDWADMSNKIEAGKKELSDLQAKIDNARDTIAQLMRV